MSWLMILGLNLIFLAISGGIIYLVHRRRCRTYRRFFEVLWIDLKAWVGEDIILPTSIEEALKFYPGLPRLEECLELPVKELISKVSWTIDPNKYGLNAQNYHSRGAGWTKWKKKTD